MKPSIWIGFEPRETVAFAVARDTIRRHTIAPIPVHGIILDDMKKKGLFYREQEMRDGQLWDIISDAPCATQFSISRFLTPFLAKTGMALFIDCDFMAMSDVGAIFNEVDKSKAVWCVKHNHNPDYAIKMDNQIQTKYPRKNWSSCMVFNCDHPSNKKLTIEMVNELPGRDLHNFCWLEDDEIGELHPKWNYLSGHTKIDVDPVFVHHTDGVPAMAGYEDAEYADDWWESLYTWAR